MLEAGCCQREVERGLIVEAGEAAVQHAGREGVAGADAIHDGGSEYVRVVVKRSRLISTAESS